MNYVLNNERYKGDALLQKQITTQTLPFKKQRNHGEQPMYYVENSNPAILDGLQNHPMEYDDTLVRQIIECVVVESKEKIKVVFIGGTEIEMTL